MLTTFRVGGGLRCKTRYCDAYKDSNATLDDLREAVSTLEEIERIVRRVFGGAHPLTRGIDGDLRDAQAALRARQEAASGDVSVSGIRKAVEAMTTGDA